MKSFTSVSILLATVVLLSVTARKQKHHHDQHHHGIKTHHHHDKSIPQGRAEDVEDDVNIASKTACPGNTDVVHRLGFVGKSRFYLLQPENGGALGLNWAQSREKCKELGLKLAKVDKIYDEIYLQMEVNRFQYKRKWSNTYYWMDAKFDQHQQMYIWQDTKKPIKISNFYYRVGYPKGYGDYYSRTKYFIPDPTKREPMCLAFALPLPFGSAYGHSASWYERGCNETWYSNIMCESTNPACEEEQNNKQNKYLRGMSRGYFPGVFPMSDRRYAVSFEPRNFQDAKKFCEKHGMQLYEPSENDYGCLIPVLKNRQDYLTTYNFWTSVTFNLTDRVYRYRNGTAVPKQYRDRKYIKLKSEGEGDIKLSSYEKIISKQTCASMFWQFEVTPYNQNACGCNFNGIMMGPENCKNPMGVICQPTNYENYPCTTRHVSYLAEDNTPRMYEIYPFNGKEDYYRTAYKQKAGYGICQPGYYRVNVTDHYWGTAEDYEDAIYKYDITEKYWLWPNSNGRGNISWVTYDADAKTLTRHIKEENDQEYLGFLLCKSPELYFRPK